MWNGDRTTTDGLLSLPPEIRLIIFTFFLHLALDSRYNGNFGLLQAYTHIAAWAGSAARQHLYFKDESRIRGLLFDAHRVHLA